MELQIFNNSEFGQIRTVIVDSEPMFCLADVCKALEITHITDVKNRLKQDGVGTAEVIDNIGRKQNATFINESNLYKTIFQSRKESAERFTDWVTSEVLPSIRKTES
jgi:prophage antirepressor-like protein